MIRTNYEEVTIIFFKWFVLTGGWSKKEGGQVFFYKIGAKAESCREGSESRIRQPQV